MDFCNFSDYVKNPAFITPWTFIHFVSGIFTYMLLEKFITKDVWVNFYIFLFVHIGYELKDLSYYMKIVKIRIGQIIHYKIVSVTFYFQLLDFMGCIL